MLRLCGGTLLLAFVLAGCAAPGSGLPPVGGDSPQAYRLGPGDRIRVSVVGVEAVDREYVIGDTGDVSLPLIGSVKAGGSTTRELEKHISDRATAAEIQRNPNTSVEVEQYRPFFILGEVQRPGLYPYVPGMTFRTAVAVAGGYTFRAEESYASVTRETAGKPVEGRASPTTAIMPGDTIYVYESWF